MNFNTPLPFVGKGSGWAIYGTTAESGMEAESIENWEGKRYKRKSRKKLWDFMSEYWKSYIVLR